MNYYQDITLLPDADIGLHFIWEKVYQQIHLALVEMQDDQGKQTIGVAFPGYNAERCQLGDKLRLLAGTEDRLKRLDAGKWLSRLSDYAHLTGIREVPGRIQGHACYYRIQPKSNHARLARRKARRENIGIEQALAALANFTEQQTDAPYVWTKSQSNGQRFRLFIGHAVIDGPADNGFNAYGLSRQSSVPVF